VKEMTNGPGSGFKVRIFGAIFDSVSKQDIIIEDILFPSDV